MNWITTFNKDLEWGLGKEKELTEELKEMWRQVIETATTDVLDFKIEDKNGNEVWLELKSRRCEKDTYPDTMIWLNKLIEAYKRYNDSWLYTLFLFKFTDWIYYINPFFHLPRFDYRMGRWDRWKFDKEKWWIYYNTNELNKLWK